MIALIGLTFVVYFLVCAVGLNEILPAPVESGDAER